MHSQPPHLNIKHMLCEVYDVFHEIFTKYWEGNQYRIIVARYGMNTRA
jgi:hypothetical protein